METSIKPILKEKAVKFVKARMKGLSLARAAKEAGYAKTGNLMQIERSRDVQAVSKTFKDAILKQFTKDELVVLLKRNAVQDEDKGASNKATQLLMDRVEPPEMPKEVNNKVLMIFR